MNKIFTLVLIFISSWVFGQDHFCRLADETATPRQHPVDITRMVVELSFVPNQAKVIGKVTHYFTGLQKNIDSIFFDAPSINIKSVKMDNKDLNFKIYPEGVAVYLNATWQRDYKLEIEYEANPRKGIYFIGWDQYNDSIENALYPNPAREKMKAQKNDWKLRNQIWTQGQGIDNRHWIPMYDEANDKYITETIVTFDSKYKVLSNGTLKSEKKNKNGTSTWHYAMTHPHAGYLLMLGIGEYAVKSAKTKRGVPYHFWYYPDQEYRVEPTFRHMAEMIDFMEKETGINYPWESYSQIMVQDFLYGAMENTTATIFGDFFYVDERSFTERNYVGVNCHELVHQWFGDYITHRSNADIWLHESYATFYPKLFNKTLLGDDAYSWQERGEANAALAASLRDDYPVRHTKGGTTRVYPKGSHVIAMLRYVYGEEEFNKVINHYLKKHGYKNVETNDLYQAFQDVLGVSPDWFFEQWVYRGGEPHYKVSYEKIQKNERSFIRVHVKQTHKMDHVIGTFKMPVNFAVYFKDGKKIIEKHWIAKEEEFVDIEVKNADVAFVLFDVNSQIMKKLDFEKSYEELAAQATMAEHMIERYDAVAALAKYPVNQKRELLISVFQKEKFHAIRSEVLKQLSGDLTSEPIFISAMYDADLNVRKAGLSFVKGWNADIQKAVIKCLETDNSYDLPLAALERLYNEVPASEMPAYLNQVKDLYGMGNAFRIKWLEISILSGYNKTDAQNELVEYLSARYEFRTRGNAFEAIKRLNYLTPTAVFHIKNATQSLNSRLANPAKQLLNHFEGQTEYKQMIEGV